MPKVATVRAELLEFLWDRADENNQVHTPVSVLAEEWRDWRAAHFLEPSGIHNRAFRQLLERSMLFDKSLSYALIPGTRRLSPIQLLVRPVPGTAAHFRQVERERTSKRSRFARPSSAAGRDLSGLPTPALNQYVSQLRLLEHTRTIFTGAGLDPKSIGEVSSDLGNEAIAIKERLLRVEDSLRRHRQYLAAQGLPALDESMVEEAPEATEASIVSRAQELLNAELSTATTRARVPSSRGRSSRTRSLDAPARPPAAT